MFRNLTRSRYKYLLVFMATLFITGLFSGGGIMAGMPRIKTEQFVTEVLFLGDFSHHPRSEQVLSSKKAVAFLVLESPKMAVDSLLIPSLEKGSIVYLVLDQSMKLKPGTTGKLDYTETSPALNPWNRYTYNQFYTPKKVSSHTLQSLFKQEEKSYYYAISVLAREGMDFDKQNIDAHLKQAHENKLLSSPNFAWLLWNDNKLEQLNTMAQNNDYAKLYYLFHLMDSKQYQLALDYLGENKIALSTMLVLFHNMTSFSGEPVYMEKDDPLFEMEAAFYQESERLDYVALCEMSIYAGLGKNKKS